MFDKDDRVMTPGGLATVVYRRMSDFDPTKVGYYAVRLDRAAYHSFSPNDLYPAREVSAVPKEQAAKEAQDEACNEGNHIITGEWSEDDYAQCAHCGKMVDGRG